jgi:hypothetical protein
VDSKSNKTTTETIDIHKMVISENGSLGLLALGSLGLRAWRAAKEEAKKKQSKQKK